MITVILAEDHQALIDGIKLSLEYEEDISVIGEANDGEALIDLVRKKTHSGHYRYSDAKMRWY